MKEMYRGKELVLLKDGDRYICVVPVAGIKTSLHDTREEALSEAQRSIDKLASDGSNSN